jgi:uncharacterized membrane protein YbhN (UPF0104 family)
VRRWLRPAVGALVALAFLWLGFRRLDWRAIGDAWTRADAAPLALGLLALALGFGVRIARWWLMLRASAPGLAFGACVRPFLVSIALNNTVPLRAGDVVRAVGFRDVLRAPGARVVGTLVLERILDLLALLVIFFVGLVGLGRARVPDALVSAATVAGSAALAALVALVLAPGRVRALLEWALSRGPLARRTGGMAAQFVEPFALLQRPGVALPLVLLSFAGWLLEGGLYLGAARALGLELPPLAPLFALATGTLATLLPSSPGYVGTFDYFAMQGLVAYGVGSAQAAAFAILVHLLLWAPVTVTGALLLLAPRSRAAWRRASGAAEVA